MTQMKGPIAAFDHRSRPQAVTENYRTPCVRPPLSWTAGGRRARLRANVRAILVAQRLEATEPFADAKRTRVCAEREGGVRRVVGEHERRLPLPDLDDEIVADLRCHSLAVRADLDRRVVRADAVTAGLDRHERMLRRRHGLEPSRRVFDLLDMRTGH
jgi:hypothetical protein